MAKESSALDEARVRYRFGSAEFDAHRLDLRVGGKQMQVQRKPLEILRLLLARAGSIVTREELLETVWGGRPIVDNVIASAITKLRNALGHENAMFIVTHPRVGYRFTGLVQRVTSLANGCDCNQFVTGASVPYRSEFAFADRLECGQHNEVWTARHVNTRELRVYKLCRGDDGLSGLRREAALLQFLQQQLGERTDIARALDWNLDIEPYFIGYEFGGTDLEAWSREEPGLGSLSREERVALFVSIARSVAAVHEAGVIHQDLKPSNILIARRSDASWHVRLSDFGSGRLLQPERLAKFRITQFGLLSAEALTSCSSSATPLYVAPELLAGHPASEQSDAYSLGVLLYQLLIGDLRKPLAPGWEREIDDELLREDIAEATDCDLTRRFAKVDALCVRLSSLAERRAALRESELAQQAALAAHETHLCRRASRIWIVSTVALLCVVAVQTAVLANHWLASETSGVDACSDAQAATQ